MASLDLPRTRAYSSGEHSLFFFLGRLPLGNEAGGKLPPVNG